MTLLTTANQANQADQANQDDQANQSAAFEVHCKAAMFTYQQEVTLAQLAELPQWHLVDDYTIGVEQGSHVHTHVMLTFRDTVKHSITNWHINDAPPNVNPNRTRGRGFALSVQRAHFYCACPFKKGHIRTTTNVEHPVVKAEWIKTLWTQDKLDDPVAAAAHYKCLTPHFEQTVKRTDAHRKATQRADFHARRQAILKQQQHPFKTYPIIQEFKAQFTETKQRYKFLWLHGPSRMGKTLLAKSLYRNPYVHRNGIDWSAYDPTVHDAIIFDDAYDAQEYVLRHKVLFQSSEITTVNTSKTNCYSLMVDTAEVPIIVCSNSRPHDDWVLANSYLQDIIEPTYWEQDEDADPLEDVLPELTRMLAIQPSPVEQLTPRSSAELSDQSTILPTPPPVSPLARLRTISSESEHTISRSSTSPFADTPTMELLHDLTEEVNHHDILEPPAGPAEHTPTPPSLSGNERSTPGHLRR